MNHIMKMMRASTATPPMAMPAIAPPLRPEDDGSGSGVGDGVGEGVGVGVDDVVDNEPRFCWGTSRTVVVKPRSRAQP